MKPGDLIRKKDSKTFRDGVWVDTIALHLGEVPDGVTRDDSGVFRSTFRLDIFVIYASPIRRGRQFAFSSDWEVINETG